MKIVLATRNRKKVEEIQRILQGADVSLATLDDFPDCPDVVEDGKTFRQNAIKKAKAIAKCTGMTAIADDSGLEVYALNKMPGVFSARYAGENADDRKNTEKLLYNMKGLTGNERDARFACCIALSFSDGSIKTFTGFVKGTIANEPKGSNGFGYDPVFIPDNYTKTFAEMTDKEKDSLSHRAKAIKKLYKHIRELLQCL